MSRHVNLVSPVNGLYNLLVQLTLIEPAFLVRPEDASLIQSPLEAALEARYTSESCSGCHFWLLAITLGATLKLSCLLCQSPNIAQLILRTSGVAVDGR